MGQIRDFLAKRLEAGALTIGQVRVEPGFILTHVDEARCYELRGYSNPHDAITIARYDDTGNYRPLKTAPNLAHGWRLDLKAPEDVLLAMDFFYPAAVGTALAGAEGKLWPVNLRDTLGRQSGMYAVTRKLSDEQAESLRGGFCRFGCLRRILWSVAPGKEASADDVATEGVSDVPLLCAEACNLFVAEARKVVKGGGGKQAD